MWSHATAMFCGPGSMGPLPWERFIVCIDPPMLRCPCCHGGSMEVGSSGSAPETPPGGFHSDGSLCIMVTRKIDCGVPSCCWYCEVEAVCCSPEGSKRNLAVWDLTDGQRIIKGNVAQHGLERLPRYNHRRLLLYLSVYTSASPFKNCTVKFPKYTLPHVAKTQVVLPMCFFPHRIYDEVCADFLDG